MRLIRCSAAAGLFALSGCGAASPGAHDGTFPKDEAARRRAASQVEPVWVSAPEAELSQFNHLAVDSRGNVYVPDYYQHRVAVFGADGLLVRTFGRRGGGPGEFRSVSTVQALPGDSLLVFDGTLGRVNVFAPGADRPAYTVTLPGASPWALERTRANDAFLARYESMFQFGQGADAGPREDRIRLLNLDGSRRAELLAFPGRSFIVAQQAITPNPWGHNGFARPDSRDRLHYVWSDTLGAATYDLQGRRTGGWKADYAPPPATRADLDHQLAQLPDAMRPRYRPALEDSLPQRWPAVRGFLVDDQDRLWLELAGPLGRETEWAAFTTDGAYLGSVLVPAGTSVHQVRGSSLYGRTEDEDGAYRLALFRMVRPPR